MDKATDVLLNSPASHKSWRRGKHRGAYNSLSTPLGQFLSHKLGGERERFLFFIYCLAWLLSLPFCSYYWPSRSYVPLFWNHSSASDLMVDSLSPSCPFGVWESAYFCRKIYVLLTFDQWLHLARYGGLRSNLKGLTAQIYWSISNEYFSIWRESIPTKSASEPNFYIQSKKRNFCLAIDLNAINYQIQKYLCIGLIDSNFYGLWILRQLLKKLSYSYLLLMNAENYAN